jgi:hypothetical protein
MTQSGTCGRVVERCNDVVEVLVVILFLAAILHGQTVVPKTWSVERMDDIRPVVSIRQRPNGPVVKVNASKMDYLFTEVMASVVAEGCNCADARSAKKLKFDEVWLVFSDLPGEWAADEESKRTTAPDGTVTIRWTVTLGVKKWTDYPEEKEKSSEFIFAFALAEIIARESFPEMSKVSIYKSARRAVIMVEARRW